MSHYLYLLVKQGLSHHLCIKVLYSTNKYFDVKYWRRACTQVLFLHKSGGARTFSFFRNSDRVVGTFPWCRRSPLLETGFFRQVREMKIQRKNPGSAFTYYLGTLCNVGTFTIRIQFLSQRGCETFFFSLSSKILKYIKQIKMRKNEQSK